MNSLLANQILQTLIDCGIKECCVCPGARNAPLIQALINQSYFTLYYWPEERSASFFALGRIKATSCPVAIITTSGTAAGELLPAAMEAYYSALPLILITADRPRRFRGSGAPQTAEQVGLFGIYASYSQDLAEGEACSLANWQGQGPAHLNVCFEEPQENESPLFLNLDKKSKELFFSRSFPHSYFCSGFEKFIHSISFPLVLVGALLPNQQQIVIEFLLHLQAPVYLEALSGIREEPRLKSLRIEYVEKLWQQAADHGYPIDAVLRIGGVPTTSLWRDLEKKELLVCSISEQPWTGLSKGVLIQTELFSFFQQASQQLFASFACFFAWQAANQAHYLEFISLLKSEPDSERGFIYHLSHLIPKYSKVYLGNSLPIREWDQAATYQPRHFQMAANRGLNGIEGQLATFLGYCTKEQQNFALLGDLTTLFDLVAPWISPQLLDTQATCVIINNGGGKIFSQLFSHPAFQNLHSLHFEPLARLWGWNYEQWKTVPSTLCSSTKGRFIEIIPNELADKRVREKIKEKI